VRGSDRCLR